MEKAMPRSWRSNTQERVTRFRTCNFVYDDAATFWDISNEHHAIAFPDRFYTTYDGFLGHYL